jgi:uncharacterized protein YcbK (DUF882 family)
VKVSRAINRAGLAACLVLVGSIGAQHAKAVGDTRTLSLHHVHTDEKLTITYKNNGQYDEEALKKINWIMRDWRKNQSTEMDRQEIDLLWEVYQEVGAKEPIEIICGYRSPATNNMLRGRSKRSGVARHSQHTLGKAIDFYIPGVPLATLRATAMRLQGGGVGFYPTSGSPFVHLDVGNVRAWPRMTREQLVKLFPDGRTVHLPSSGDPLPGYQLAKADLERGHRTVSEPHKRSFMASLFRRDKDAEEADDNVTARESASVSRSVTAQSEAGKSDAKKPEPSKLVPARVQLASAAEPVAIGTAPVPLPPRRPFYQVAESQPVPLPLPRAARETAPVQVAALSPNQIVNLRGLWDDLANATAARPQVADTSALSVSSARRLPAPSDATSNIGPFPARDRVSPDVALAYAAENNGGKPASPQLAPAIVTHRDSTSVASKPSVFAKSRKTPVGERLDDPWLRGLVLATSVQNSLVVSQVGDPDFTALTQFMTKPGSSVLMTFSSDPYLGMNAEQFTGSAVVFPPTMTFGTRHTASLQ